MGITENSLRMTPSENGVMQAFWNAKKPMTSRQIVEAVQAAGQATWKSMLSHTSVDDHRCLVSLSKESAATTESTYSR